MTRAKDSLHLIVPQRFYVHQQANRGDRHLYATRTRFIPAATLGLFESRSWPAASSAPRAAEPRQTARIDIGARLKRMWR
jgi:DNA helicase-2/ATP-dependent DNA helicase PcrA